MPYNLDIRQTIPWLARWLQAKEAIDDLDTRVTAVEASSLPLGLGDLTDPGADRIYFWDDSAGLSGFLSLGAGLAITGTSLNTTGTATGDMLKATYDPTNIAASPFARANHTGAQATSTITGLDTALAAKEPLGELVAIRAITASETLVLSDKGKTIEANHATVAITITVPPNASVAFPVNSRIDLVRYGAAAVTIAAGSGVTIRSKAAALGIASQYAGAQLYKRATDEWVLIGDLA